MASMAGLRGSTQVVLEGSLQISGSSRLTSPARSSRVAVRRSGLIGVRAQQAGTKNSDEARDFKLPLKDRFYLQPLSPSEASARAKESAKDILNVKGLIDKKEWPYVMNDLRLKASYLRYDLNTVINAKPKEEEKPLKELTGKLFNTIDEIKSPEEAEKYYAATKTALDDVLAKLG